MHAAMRHAALVVALLAAGCGGAVAPLLVEPDRPVPASEPRAVVHVVVDLEATQDCEETFDLEVYENRAVDLVEWDRQVGSCKGRVLSIRYLSGRTDEGSILAAIRALALRVAVVGQSGRSP